jgi:hypothetical protein
MTNDYVFYGTLRSLYLIFARRAKIRYKSKN